MSQYHSDLFDKLLKGELSPEEVATLVGWLGTGELDPQAEQLIIRHLKQDVDLSNISPEVESSLTERIATIVGDKRPNFILGKRLLRYAAVVIVFAGAGALFLTSQKKSTHGSEARTVHASPVRNDDIEPGKQGAILTLADGRTIVLDSLGNGVVATQNGAKVTLLNGQLTYGSEVPRGGDAVFNLVSTPRGRQFQVVLSDGTNVWLNSASSIRYPVTFNGEERRVEITGEAYFEVAKDKEHPFKVSINNQAVVEVLGTHFNVNSYTNEASTNTTLLEGLIRLHYNGESAVVRPGQQAQVAEGADNKTKLKLVADVNTAKVMAWKNGVFDFENASLEEMMRQLERWYDVDVVYERGQIPSLEFFGRMGRDLSLANVLRGLQVSKVHFKLEGRKLIVQP